MTIKSKLFLGFGCIILMMFFVAGLVIDRMDSLSHAQNEIYQDRFELIKHVHTAGDAVDNAIRLMTNMALMQNEETIEEDIGRLNQYTEEAINEFDWIMADERSSEHIQIMNRLLELTDQFLQYKDQKMILLEAGQYDRALERRITEGAQLYQELSATLMELNDRYVTQMENISEETNKLFSQTRAWVLGITLAALLIAVTIVILIVQRTSRGLDRLVAVLSDYAKGTINRNQRIEVTSNDEIAAVAVAFNQMAEELEDKTIQEEAYQQAQKDQIWLNTNLANMTTELQGVYDLKGVSERFTAGISPVLNASYGAFYLAETKDDRSDLLTLHGRYAIGSDVETTTEVKFGEGLVGQCATDKKLIHLKSVPSNYLKIQSGLGESDPLEVLIYPVRYEDRLLGVLELATMSRFSSLDLELLRNVTENFGALLDNIHGRIRVEELLHESQTLTEELQTQSEELITQQEELTRTNEQLENRTKALKRSEELLKEQQSVLEDRNEALMESARQLEQQVKETEETNRRVEKSKIALEQQALQLMMMSRYKSEFLANMSHELRTPLNSLLILSQLLLENKQGNLTEKQVEYAKTIHSSGEDLLQLINEILDLSKVEAGKMDIYPEALDVQNLLDEAAKSFRPIADEKQLSFEIKKHHDVPKNISSDRQRVLQILKNLLSNAFKFTDQGKVSLELEVLHDLANVPVRVKDHFRGSEDILRFTVQDTGIGIAKDQLRYIFDAFHQGDGTTSRKYGGTGLGLSISYKLANLLGGVLDVKSKEGEGSVFMLYLPAEYREVFTPEMQLESFSETASALVQETPILPETISMPVEDDRGTIQEEHRTLLIIEDDVHFARLLQDMARGRGFKTIVAIQGDEGLALARNYKPDAIILDIQLPVLDGWSILHHLQHNHQTRHIPVHVISVVDNPKQGLRMGAATYVTKPSSKEELERTFQSMEMILEGGLKRVLLVHNETAHRDELVEQLALRGVRTTVVNEVSHVLQVMDDIQHDCLILDMELDEIEPFEVLENIKHKDGNPQVPIILYTEKKLDERQEMRLKKYVESIVVKNSQSAERLLDEIALFLHHVERRMPDQPDHSNTYHLGNEEFAGKKVLIVDDDIRNVFAISSILEDYHMEISFTENGIEALKKLEEQDDFDLILMDIMMPGLDGYETMRAIRKQPLFKDLPIIAVTAKAMVDDREKCIEAGASDYIAKPIDTEQLISLMKVWLYT